LDLVRAVGIYVEKLLWPVGLNAYIDHLADGPLPLLCAGLFAAGVGFAAWRWWAAPTDGTPLYALAWLGVTLAPSLAIVWKIPDVPVAERYLYLPSVGGCLLAGWAAARVWSATSSPARHAALAAGVTVVLLAALTLTVRRNVVWHDDIALWTDTEAKSVISGMAARDLGTAYQQAGRAADARAAFERALRRRNDARGLQTIYNNLGTLAMYDADYAAAQRYYQQALAANPEAADTLFNLGLAVLQAGGATRQSAQAALPYYQHALRLSPHDSDIEAALAQVFDLLGEHADAAAHAQRALALGARGQTADGLHAILQRAAASGTSPP
jgi:tetratricopeptide (TPR) repeat protein